MNVKRLAIGISTMLPLLLAAPTSAEMPAPSSNAGPSADAVYMQYVADIHKAMKADQLPTFSHNSPLNKIKLADSRVEEREILKALKEMTPHTVKAEGRIEFNHSLYLFYEGDPEKAKVKKEYFPVTVEMVKEDGKWKLRRQQSWHVADGSIESQVIPHGQARIKRFEDLMGALTRPVPNQTVRGDVCGKPFKVNATVFMPREGYFKLVFIDGQKQFSIYIRETASLAELQGRHFVITPLEGYDADLQPAGEMFGPYCARLDFGKFTHGFVPGTISLAVRTPEACNLSGVFGAKQGMDDGLGPDGDEKDLR